MRLAEKNAVVTGASSGIGYATALRLAEEGANILVCYGNNGAGAQDCCNAIHASGGRASTLQADLSTRDGCSALASAAAENFECIDIWVNVAGADILTGSGAALPDYEKLSQLIDVDLRGTMFCSWAAAELMAKGVIINLSWDLALRGMGGRNPEMFAAVKAGVTGFTYSLARSLAPDIRVNEVSPGWIHTAFAETQMEDAYRDDVVEKTPMKRFGRPEDVANAIVFLASDEAGFITGQSLKVNGGLSS